MSANDVRVGQDGLCEIAPVGTTLPISPDAALDAAFVDLGEVSEDGLDAAFTTDYSEVKNWSGAVLRSFNTSTTVTFKLTFLETNADVLTLFYGNEVDASSGLNVPLAAPKPDPRALVITVLDGDNLKRYCLANVQVTERGDVSEKNSEATGYEITFTANFDTALEGFGYLQIAESAAPLKATTKKKADSSF